MNQKRVYRSAVDNTEWNSVQQQIRYGSIVCLTKRNEISKFHNIFVCVNCVCYECYACGHIRIHTKRMHDCMQAPAMHPLENFKKVIPMLSHFLFQNFSLLARNVDRNVPDIAARCSFIVTLDNYVWSAYCHQSEIKIIYHDLGGSVFFLVAALWNIITVYCSGWFVIQST